MLAQAGDSLQWVVGLHQPEILLLTPEMYDSHRGASNLTKKKSHKEVTGIPKSWSDNSTAWLYTVITSLKHFQRHISSTFNGSLAKYNRTYDRRNVGFYLLWKDLMFTGVNLILFFLHDISGIKKPKNTLAGLESLYQDTCHPTLA